MNLTFFNKNMTVAIKSNWVSVKELSLKLHKNSSYLGSFKKKKWKQKRLYRFVTTYRRDVQEMVSGDKLLGPRGRDTRHNARPVAEPSSVRRRLF